MNQDSREEYAFESLLAYRLAKGAEQQSSCSDLSLFTDAEKASLKCLKPNFIAELIKAADSRTSAEDIGAQHEAARDNELICGLNRAEEIDESTRSELDRERARMIGDLRKRRDE